MRVLLVEDYGPLQKSLAKGLREAGYAVDVAGDGEEGLWYARSCDYDAIPDFADGFDRDGDPNTTADNQTAGEKFTPLVLEVPAPIDLSKVKIKFDYDGSDPNLVTFDPNGFYTPGTGRLRLWKKAGDQARNKASIVSDGDYVAPYDDDPNHLITAEHLGLSDPNRTVTLYMEGIAPSAALASTRILVEADPDGDGGAGFVLWDAVGVTVARIDADVDSDNSDPNGSPTRNSVEDQHEDISGDPNYPGRYVPVNDDNSDPNEDSIPDFADGFDRDGDPNTTADNQTAGEDFTPLVLDVPAPVDLSKVKIKFTYDASDPNSVTVDPNGVYTPGAGRLRLWKKAGDQARNKASIVDGGHYVAPYDDDPNHLITAEHLGVTGESRTVTLYMEGIAPSEALASTRILVEGDPDGAGPAGFVLMDAVRVTVLRLKVKDMSFNHDRSAHNADGVNIRKSYTAGTEITAPEWEADANDPGIEPDTCDEVLYVKEKRVTVNASLSIEPSIPTAKVRAVGTRTAIGGSTVLSLGNLGNDPNQEESWKTVTFTSGDANDVSFVPQNATSSVILREEAKFQWLVSELGGVSIAPLKFTLVGQDPNLVIFTILDDPQPPWDPNGTTGNLVQPWVSALNVSTRGTAYGTTWAEGKGSITEAATAITEGIYNCGQLTYDVPGGDTKYGWATFNATCFIAQIRTGDPNDPNSNRVNCKDCANGVVTLANILGCNLTNMKLSDDIHTRPISAIKNLSWGSTAWGWHAVGWSGPNLDTGHVFDACLRLNEPPPYIPCDKLFTDYRSDLRESGTCERQSALPGWFKAFPIE